VRTPTCAVTVIALAAAAVSCGQDSIPFVPTPQTAGDARLISLVLGQTLRPDEALAEAVARELMGIQDRFGDEIPELSKLHPYPPWLPNTLIVTLTAGAWDSVRNGTYTAWDSLNAAEGGSLYRVGQTDTRVTLRFDDMVNPRYMASRYLGIPGVVEAYRDGLLGDWPNVYPLQRDAGRTYLFRDAGGDCLLGCTTYGYWYFRAYRGSPEFVGHWVPRAEPEPPWWEEAEENREFFYDW
jgi:hypothetical protein